MAQENSSDGDTHFLSLKHILMKLTWVGKMMADTPAKMDRQSVLLHGPDLCNYIMTRNYQRKKYGEQ